MVRISFLRSTARPAFANPLFPWWRYCLTQRLTYAGFNKDGQFVERKPVAFRHISPRPLLARLICQSLVGRGDSRCPRREGAGRIRLLV